MVALVTGIQVPRGTAVDAGALLAPSGTDQGQGMGRTAERVEHGRILPPPYSPGTSLCASSGQSPPFHPLQGCRDSCLLQRFKDPLPSSPIYSAEQLLPIQITMYSSLPAMSCPLLPSLPPCEILLRMQWSTRR